MKISELNGLLKPEKEDYIPIVDNSEKETKKASISALIDLFYPIGSYYETSDADFNPNEKWGGTWNLDADGTVLASQNLETGSNFNKSLGTIIGEETHVLQKNELANGVALTRQAEEGEWSLGLWENHGQTSQTWSSSLQGQHGLPEGGTPISLAQPTKIIARWHREA